MQTTPKRVLPSLLFHLAIACLLLCPTFTWAQDSPGRFELGANFTADHFSVISTVIGPGVEGDVNFTRHIALDAAYNWQPSSGGVHFITGLFGAKVGTRTKHFGFFGKVRPGFMSLSPIEREITNVFDLQAGTISETSRSARVNERVLDLGGVVEYYPSRHCAIRWDFSNLMQFAEAGPTITDFVVGDPQPTFVIKEPGSTFNRFQFSTAFHYRF